MFLVIDKSIFHANRFLLRELNYHKLPCWMAGIFFFYRFLFLKLQQETWPKCYKTSQTRTQTRTPSMCSTEYD